MSDYYVITRDEEGDVASLIGPFGSGDAADAFIESIGEDGNRLRQRLFLAEVTRRTTWTPDEWVADKSEWLDDIAALDDACGDDPDGVHHVGCGCDAIGGE